MRFVLRLLDVPLLDVTLSRGSETLADLWTADELLEAQTVPDDDEEA